MKVQGKTIKMLRFADNIALLAHTERELDEALNIMEIFFKLCNIKTKNIKKTKVIACRTRSEKKRLNIKIRNEEIG